MKKSPLFEFYSKQEPVTLQKIINEKYNSEFKHKITSRRMFKMEVEIMTNVIEQLNSKGIYVLYVYDALLCHPNDALEVSTIMNRIILEHGVKTTVKDSSDKKHNPVIDDCVLIDANEICFNLTLKEELLQKNSNNDKFEFIDAWIDFHDGKPIKEKVLKISDEINPHFKYMTRDFIYESPSLVIDEGVVI